MTGIFIPVIVLVMPRPSLLPLHDEHARHLVRALVAIEVAHPHNLRDHRPFVRAFLRAVYEATGRTFSPAIYRKLLVAYAPGRSPSTSTLANEKNQLEAQLQMEAGAQQEISQTSEQSFTQLNQVVRQAVEDGLHHHTQERPSARHASALQEQHTLLQQQLFQTEQRMQESRQHSERLAAELAVSQALKQMLATQLSESQQQVGQLSTQVGKLATEVEGMRKFALNAIEVSRGEIRTHGDRVAYLEAQLAKEKNHTEVFRRLAYRGGASIPAQFLPKDE